VNEHCKEPWTNIGSVLDKSKYINFFPSWMRNSDVNKQKADIFYTKVPVRFLKFVYMSLYVWYVGSDILMLLKESTEEEKIYDD